MSTGGSERGGVPGAPPIKGAAREIARAQDQLFGGGSARAKYSALIVGRPGLGALIKYEFVTLLCQWVPGALGLALRKVCYRWLLGSCGRNVVFGQNVVLRHPHKIHIADNVVVDDNCLLDAKGDANQGIRIGRGVFVGRNTILSCKNGDIEIGDGVFIGRNTILSCKNGDIELGDKANIGFNCELFSASRVTIGSSALAPTVTRLAEKISQLKPMLAASASSMSPFLHERIVLRPTNTPLPIRMPWFESPLASRRQ